MPPLTTTVQARPAPDPVDPDWWRGAVIYQIYPRSFQDTNGDGVGDLAGIIRRLPYVASLGVDAIWISPFFRSPMLDFGYDVSDYRDVDPMFGSLVDFDALLVRAHELGLRVLIDLVLSHSSHLHPWFQESRSSRDNLRADWYVWADPRPDGTPPNNWLSVFGGSAWAWDGQRMQYYLHNFLAEQPDLNLHHPEVQNALLDVARFWLKRGVDGFRLDTVNFYFHDARLRSNPALSPGNRNDAIAPGVNPYNWQDHKFDKSQPENIAFLKRLRAMLDEFPGTTALGEVGDAQRGPEIQADYTSGGDRIHMCYDFSFLSGGSPDGDWVAGILRRFETTIGDGWACWAFSNHDVRRHPSRWNLGEAAKRTYAALLLSLRGSVCLYQGEELGLTDARIAFEDLQDPYGIRFWPTFKGRDGSRTPIPWVNDNRHGGFSDSKPWLPVAVEHLPCAVSAQGEDKESTLAFYRRMIAFRRCHPALAKGTIDILEAAEDRIGLIRAHEGVRLYCGFNLSDRRMNLRLPDGAWRSDPTAPFAAILAEGVASLGAWQAVFAVEEN